MTASVHTSIASSPAARRRDAISLPACISLVALAVILAAIAFTDTAAPLANAQPASIPGRDASDANPADPNASAAANAQAMRQLHAIWNQLEAGDRDAALEAARQLARTLPVSEARRSAKLLVGQLQGSFASRQQHWLDRRVENRLVLVPDEAAFLQAVKQWRPDRYWPVLIEDAWFTPMFINAFAPARVERWNPKTNTNNTNSDDNNPAENASLDQQLIQLLAAHNAQFAQPDRTPPGLVMLEADAPTRMGGLALALGRRQPVLIQPYDGPATPDITDINSLLANSLTTMARLRLFDEGTWCALTLAGDYPYRMPLQGQKGDWAVDDLLGRTPAGQRVAVVGRLIGDPTFAVYQAMASLFLQPQSVMLFNTYDRAGRPWDSYAFHNAEKTLSQRYTVTHVPGGEAEAGGWLRATRPTHRYDMFWINSSGGASKWNLRAGGDSDHMPFGRPAPIHMIHSFSARSPENPWTVAGFAIRGGAYWYFGSVYEPYLTAFTPPTGLAHKAVVGTPLAFAARRLPGQPGSQPWRLALLGDPLFTLRQTPAQRIAPGPALGDIIAPSPEAAPAAQAFDPAAQLREVVIRASLQPNRQQPNAIDAPEDQAVIAAAKAVLASPLAQRQPDAVDRAMYELNARGRLIVDGQPRGLDLARSAVIARAIVLQSLRERYDDAMADRDLVAAGANLMRLVRLDVTGQTLPGRIDRWLLAMKANGQGQAAADLLRDQLQHINARGVSNVVNRSLDAFRP